MCVMFYVCSYKCTYFDAIKALPTLELFIKPSSSRQRNQQGNMYIFTAIILNWGFTSVNRQPLKGLLAEMEY